MVQQRSFVNKKTKTALPVLLQRQALADSGAPFTTLGQFSDSGEYRERGAVR